MRVRIWSKSIDAAKLTPHKARAKIRPATADAARTCDELPEVEADTEGAARADDDDTVFWRSARPARHAAIIAPALACIGSRANGMQGRVGP